MSAANSSGPTPSILTSGIDVESTARELGLTEDMVRRLCLEHELEILRRMKVSAEDSIRELAYSHGLIPLGDPEIPEAVIRSVAKFSNHRGVFALEAYRDRPPTRFSIVEED